MAGKGRDGRVQEGQMADAVSCGGSRRVAGGRRSK